MMIRTQCPLGGNPADDIEVYPASFELADANTDTFSARRPPDRVHYRMVRNTATGLLRADPILDDETVNRLYTGSKVTYEDTAAFTAVTYAEYLSKALPHLPDKRAALEIGCGHGFFLETLLDAGFVSVKGVEPSSDAVARASPNVKPHIVEAPFSWGFFRPESFSLVCGFQVLDHLIRPNDVLAACREALVPGGVMYWICHDVGSPLARILGERCPMVDIQHVVLYDRKTLPAVFERNGFETIEVFGVSNRYPLSYWAGLAPLPAPIKMPLIGFLNKSRIGRLPLGANLGNMGIIARKRESSPGESH